MGVCTSTNTGENPKSSDEKQTKQPEMDGEGEEEDSPEMGPNFIFGMENVKDEIQIPAIKEKYPNPLYLRANIHRKAKPVDWFDNWSPIPRDNTSRNSDIRISSAKSNRLTPNNINMQDVPKRVSTQEVDDHARNVPRSVYKSFSELIKFLTNNLQQSHQREMLTVRAIIVWLSNQDVQEIADGTGNQETPEGFLILLRQKKTTYTTFFTVLCRKAGIMCVQIRGVAKCGSYVPGDNDFSNLQCIWNAIYIDGKWKLVHPFWTCISLLDHRAAGWIKLESDVQAVGKCQRESDGIFKNLFTDYYFLTNPKEFIYVCRPNDERWQLLQKPVSYNEFKEMPYLLPPFFRLGLKLKSKSKSLLKTNTGTISIKLEAPLTSANLLDMWYEIYFKEGSSGSDTEDEVFTADTFPRLVTMIRNGKEWKFNIQFPVEGIYKLCLYGGPHKTPLLRVCEFRLDCERRKENCLLQPFNPGIVGFGPGPTSEEAGLFVPSHRNGFIYTRQNCELKIIFHVDDEILSSSIAVNSELINNDSGERTEVKCHTDQSKKLLRLTATIPDNNEYSLTIATGTDNSFLYDDQVQNDFKNVCNYYISTRLSPFEHANKTNARKELEDVFEGEDVDELQNAIHKCLREKIDPNDDQILAARGRLGYLKAKKDIREAFQRRNTGIVVKTIRFLETSPYRGALKTEIDSLERFREQLEDMGTFTQLPPDIHRSLSELASITKPKWEIYDTLQALLLLLGESEDSMTCWEDLVDLFHPGLGRHTALYRIRHIQEGRQIIDTHIARKADRLLHLHTFDDVRRMNMAAATIYQWTDAVIGMYLNDDESTDESEQ